MYDYLHSALQGISHNRYTAIAVALAISASAWMFGCQPLTASLVDTGGKVTAQQLNREVVNLGLSLAGERAELEAQAAAAENAIYLHNLKVESLNEQIGIAEVDLAVQAQQRQQVVSLIAGVATSAADGTMSPAGLINGVISLLGIGAAVGIGADNVRKNAVIKRLKTEAGPPTKEA